MIQDGNFIQSYKLNSAENNKYLYSSTESSKISLNSDKSLKCKKSSITLYHHCSTHWNPPAHVSAYGCRHAIEWHSPYSCKTESTNYEKPCYIFDPKGKLIDLTPWILSNGTSYEVNTTAVENIKKFNLNICNEAHDACGSNVAACYLGEKGRVESGYNNLTSIKYDEKEKIVMLSTLGQHNEKCPDQRVRTTVRFLCKNRQATKTQPRLMKTSVCENIVDWETIHACPVTETQVPATQCAINYKPLNLNIDLKTLTGNRDLIRTPKFTINGQQKTMMLGLCQGINSTVISCEGRSTSTTSACLLAADLTSDKNFDANSTVPTNSEVVGSITKSFIRLADSRLYLESYALNKTCSYPVSSGFNITRQVGTRIEFFCSPDDHDEPTFLSNGECVYAFEWGSKKMCFETSIVEPVEAKKDDNSKQSSSANKSSSISKKLSDQDLKIDMKDVPKTSQEQHRETVKDSKQLIDVSKDTSKNSSHEKSDSNKTESALKHPESNNQSMSKQTDSNQSTKNDAKILVTKPTSNRMNKIHKFFMICLIVMSLAGFIVIIFILDKKTKLRIPLGSIGRQARQAFQTQPVPYTRVDRFNDLDL